MVARDFLGRLGLLRSKVARRIFLLFVACAMIPLLVLAAVLFLTLRAHLDRLSHDRLHQACKSAGMAIIDRVSLLETDLQLVAADLPVRNPAGVQLSARLAERMSRHFRNLTVLGGDGRTAAVLIGPGAAYGRLTAEQQAHVEKGEMLVVTASVDGRPAVFAVQRAAGTGSNGEVIAGQVDLDYLFGGEGFAAPSAEFAVLGKAGELLYSSMPEADVAGQLREAVGSFGASGRFEWQRGDDRFVASYWTIFMRPQYLAEWVVVQSELRGDVQQPLRDFAWTFSLILLLAFWVVTLASLRQIRQSTGPIEQLLEATRRLKAEDFSHRVRITSGDEFADVGAAFNDMTESIERHLHVMSTINRIGVSLSVERSEAHLLETVVLGAQTVCQADGSAIVLLQDGRPRLTLAHVKSLSLWERLPDVSRPGDRDRHGLADAIVSALGHATERTVCSADVYAETSEDFSALCEFDRRNGYRSRSLLSVPLRNHEQEVIGILALVNARGSATGQVVAFSDKDRLVIESLASQAAVAITKNRLVEDFKGLFEGLTDLISSAIDEQSPHTGGHVRRVVELSTMIAEALPRSGDAGLRSRALSEEELYELRIAALLHDCGKLTTPVHLTDKATKLHAIVDRMRLVEARAEAARRQQRLDLLEATLRELAPSAETLAEIDSRSADVDRRIEKDLAALRACNQGGEFMADETWARVQAIAARYAWTSLRGETETLVSPDELYNLGVRYGTLTPEEREIIQGHVLSTMRMLERLPYPKRLRNVPLYAGTHHEQISGNGYPLHLAGEEIPIQGRIIAVADVLEALTARDRPYRRALNLPEAMERLGAMAREGAIDPDLYDLVVSQGIHRRYAEEHL
jgi:HD-GYP domain-containing protein (c-di-GMP phosphodiesterase class II)/HAMP domain-containing protein